MVRTLISAAFMFGLFSGGGGFTPVTHTYTSGTSEVVPTNSTSVTITVFGAGGGGGQRSDVLYGSGGGGGGKAVRTFAVTSADWGKSIAFVIAGAAGGSGSTTITFPTSPALSAAPSNLSGGGGVNGDTTSGANKAGGVFTGAGWTLTNGGAGATQTGGSAPSPGGGAGGGAGVNGGIPGGGGGGGSTGDSVPAGNGAVAQIAFAWS